MANADLFDRIRFRGQPIADPRSVLLAGRARFTLLTDRLVRMEWSESGAFDDRGTYAFPTRLGPVPGFRASPPQPDGEMVVETGALALRYRLGCPFEAGTLSVAVHSGGTAWQPGAAARGNLRGTRRTLDACEGDATLEEGLLSRSGWALFDDSRSVRFDSAAGWVSPAAEPPYRDWYLFAYGQDYKAALADYARFGGAIPLIPRYVLGAWWSRYWAYSAAGLEKLVHEFERHGFPLDVLVIDMDWHTPHAWTGYTWNRDLFPDPPGFLKWVHDKGLRATLNLHPAQGVQPFEEAYAKFARAMGVDPAGAQPVAFHISDPAFVQSYFELLHHPMEEQGVDFWWVDWQQGEASEMRGLDPLPWLNHLHFSDSRRRGQRPMLYSRWGGLGNHRYPIGFSGDTYVTWAALQFQPYLTATASNVAYGWWSHDIGGHMGGATEPELFARWVQFGALSPVLRLHATKDPRAERRPWAYPRRVCRAARAAFLLRYQLIPYLYTMARIAADTGISLCRPIYYEHPAEEAAYVARYQYYLGDQMIAAPIVHPADPVTGLASTDLWLPPGDWIDFSTLERFSGPGWVRIVGDLDRIPLLVRAGGIIPLAGTMRPGSPPHLSSGTTASIPDDRLMLAVFPGEHGAFRLYEDDGTTEAYRGGQFEWTPITSRLGPPDQWQVHIGAVEGSCPGLPLSRSIEVRLMGSCPPQSVTVDGHQHDDWSYDPASLATTIRIPECDKRSPISVSASSSSGMDALGEAHNLGLIRADVARLLRLRRSRQLERASADELLEIALRSKCAGQADAIARLGGPFVRVMEHGGLDQAADSLGRVVVAAPREAGGPLEVEARLRVEPAPASAAGTHERTFRSTDLANDLVLTAPPAPLHPVRSGRWVAGVSLAWRGTTLSSHYTSPPLFPSVYAWQGLAGTVGGRFGSWEQVCDAQGVPRAELPWIDLSQTPDGLVNVHQPHNLFLERRFASAAAAGTAPVAYLATAILSPDDREAVLQFRSFGPVEVRLNGQPLPVEPGEFESTVHPRLRPTRRAGPARLHRGTNTLVVECRPAEGRSRRWTFGASLTAPGGEVMLDLVYGLPSFGHEAHDVTTGHERA